MKVKQTIKKPSRPSPIYDYHKDYGMHVGDNERRRMQKAALGGGFGIDEMMTVSHMPYAKQFAHRLSQGGSLGSGGNMIPERVKHDRLDKRAREHYFGRPVMKPRDHAEAGTMQHVKHNQKPIPVGAGLRNPDLTNKEISRIRHGEYNPNIHPRGNMGRPSHIRMQPHHGYGDPRKYTAGTIR